MFQGNNPNQQQQPPNNNQQHQQQQPQMSAAEAQLYSLAMQQQMSSILAILQQQQQQAAGVPLMQQQLHFPGLAQSAGNFQPAPSNQPAAAHPFLNFLRMRAPDQRAQPQQQMSAPAQQASPQTSAAASQASRVVPLPSHTFQSQSQYVESQSPGELSRRRPSLMSNFTVGSPSTSGSMMYPAPTAENSRSILNFHTQFNQQQVTSTQPEAIDVEDEAAKRSLSERMEKIDRERIQTNSTLKTAIKKMDLCKKIILSNKEPEEDSEVDEGETGELKDCSTNEIDSLVDKIYADNKKKAMASITIFEPFNTSTVESINLDETYEKGLKLLPSLINAMRIRRNKQKESLDEQQLEYADQLSVWEKKVAKCERNPKKIARDVKHREIFEKTFAELKKQREEKERNNRLDRVERSRCSLTGGGASSSIDFKDNEYETADAKMRSVALIPPLFTTTPHRFYENKNGLVENALTDARNRLESFLNVWSEEEKEIFSKKIAIYGKNFAAISAFLQSKSVNDCVLMYYMSKKRKQYKLKFAKRRKKIGRQYRPPIMPAAHELDACNDQFPSGARSSSYVECLLCEARINVFPASRDAIITPPFYDPYGFDLADECVAGSNLSICAKCTNLANKNKAANRCPLGSCMCGKRKMKPVRTVPEKFHSLSAENKRFIVYRLKLPPAATKCCTLCNKKISREVENLLDGQLKDEMEAFNQKIADVSKRKKDVLKTISDDEDQNTGQTLSISNAGPMPSEWSNLEEQDDKHSLLLRQVIETKDVLMEVDQGSTPNHINQEMSGAPPYKEIKLEIPEPNVLPVIENRNIKVKKEEIGDTIMTTKENLPTTCNLLSPKVQNNAAHNFGSITQGTPMVRPASLKGIDFPVEQLLAQQNAALLAVATDGRSQLVEAKGNEMRNSPALIVQQQQQQAILKGLPEELNNFESFASNLLEHFGICTDSKDASNELSLKLLQTPEIKATLEQLKQQQLRASLMGSVFPGTSSLPDFSASMNQFPNKLIDPNLTASLLNANAMAVTNQAQPVPSMSLTTPSILSTASLLDNSLQRRGVPAVPEAGKPKTVKQYLQQQQQQASSSKRIELANNARASTNGPAKEASSINQQQPSSADITDSMKRKSGIATALLPTPASSSATNPTVPPSTVSPQRIPIHKSLSGGIKGVFPLANQPAVVQPTPPTFLPPKDSAVQELAASSNTPNKQLHLNASLLQAFSPALRIAPGQKLVSETEAKPEGSKANEVDSNWGEPAVHSGLPAPPSLLPEQMMEEALRSVSVKAESNYGGVSSSCYESLSDSDDGEEDFKKPPDGPNEFTTATTMYSVLSLPTITDQKGDESSTKVSTPPPPFISSIPVDNTRLQPVPTPADSSSHQPPTCIYEPLSDDDD